MTVPPRFPAQLSGLLVVDVQTKLLAAIPNSPRLVEACSFVLDAAEALGIPKIATEQYPQGLGETDPRLQPLLPAHRPAKRGFSACDADGVTDLFRRAGRMGVVVCGIETHVCVSQTCLDLLALGFQVAVIADACGSRFANDHAVALKRLAMAGAVITTAEAAVFEWLETADHPQFRAISTLVKLRGERLRSEEIL